MLAGEGPKIAQKLGMASSQRMSVCQALEELGVPQAYDREPHTLSSGQEQRARLASGSRLLPIFHIRRFPSARFLYGRSADCRSWASLVLLSVGAAGLLAG